MKVKITETLTTIINVDKPTAQEALDYVQKLYEQEKIVLKDDDFDSVDFEIVNDDPITDEETKGWLDEITDICYCCKFCYKTKTLTHPKYNLYGCGCKESEWFGKRVYAPQKKCEKYEKK